MLFNKVSGGAEKVTIDGKPAREKINLYEIDAERIHKPLTNGNFNVLTKHNNIYYVKYGTYGGSIFKGNPQIGWTEIINQMDIKGISIVTYIEIKDDGSLYLITKDYNYTIWIYQFKEGELTLLDTIDTVYSENFRNAFKLHDELYIVAVNSSSNPVVYKRNDKTMTDITSNITNVDGLRYAFMLEHTNVINNKLIALTHGSKSYVILQFDGKTVTRSEKTTGVNETLSNVFFTTPSQPKNNELKNIILLFNSSSYKLASIKLLNTDFTEVNYFEIGNEKFSRESNTFVETKENTYRYFVKNGGKLIEFPIKAYVKE